jgi:hypothetical protein
MAAQLRSSTSTVMMDSVRSAREDRQSGAAARERQVGGRTFQLKDSVWTDVRDAGTTRVVTVKAYSKAYFDLLKQLPELSAAVALGEQVTVVGRGVVVSIRSTTGVETLADAELKKILQDW